MARYKCKTSKLDLAPIRGTGRKRGAAATHAKHVSKCLGGGDTMHDFLADYPLWRGVTSFWPTPLSETSIAAMSSGNVRDYNTFQEHSNGHSQINITVTVGRYSYAPSW